MRFCRAFGYICIYNILIAPAAPVLPFLAPAQRFSWNYLIVFSNAMKRCLPGLLCLFISIQSFGQTLENDRLALVAIYIATSTGINEVYGEPNFNDITGWNIPGAPGDSPCGWTGVTCEGGRVTRLDLSMFQVNGPLAPEVGNLSELKYLNIQQGGAEFYPMTGNIPATLGNLQKLEYLEMRGNVFTGTNMEVIGTLTKLTHLAFDTPPSWTIPNSFQNLINLEHLYFGIAGGWAWSTMGSVGNIPSYFGNFTKLKTLSMPWAGASGPIPASLGNLTNLEVLDLHHNYLTGQIPASFSNLAKLTLLDLSDNALTGTIPGATKFTNLTKMDLSNNELESMVPDLSAIPISADVNIANNKISFSGLESNVPYLDTYSPQKDISIIMGFPGRDLYANAGGMESNCVFKWYFQGQLIFTGNGDDAFRFEEEGLYKVEVTNVMVPGLTLKGEIDATILPVALISFEGKSENNQTKLTWKTTSETNNKGFEIERGADARTFEKIGFVDGSGDTKERQDYHFTDLEPFVVSYYRLKQLDYDGKSDYSRVVSVKGEGAILKIFPNPAQEHLSVSGIGQSQQLTIVDQNGRIVLKRQVADKEQVRIGKLASGIYTVKIGNQSRSLLINN